MRELLGLVAKEEELQRRRLNEHFANDDGHRVHDEESSLRMFGTLPQAVHRRLQFDGTGDEGSGSAIGVTHCVTVHDCKVQRQEPKSECIRPVMPLWMQLRELEDQFEQQTASERQARAAVQLATEEASRQYEKSEKRQTAMEQEIASMCTELVEQQRAFDSLTGRLQAQKMQATTDSKTQSEKFEADVQKLQVANDAIQLQIKVSRDRVTELERQKQEKDQANQSELVHFQKHICDLKERLQAELAEKDQQHGLAMACVWQQMSEVRAQVAQEENDILLAQGEVAGLRATLMQVQEEYQKSMALIAQALHK